MTDKSKRGIAETLAKEKESDLVGNAGMVHVRVGTPGIVYIPAAYYIWALASPSAESIVKSCFGWRFSLNVTKGPMESTRAIARTCRLLRRP